MGINKARKYRTFDVPDGYHDILWTKFSESGGHGSNKTYLVIVSVGFYKDNTKAVLLYDKLYNFNMSEDEITIANIEEELKLDPDFLGQHQNNK